MNKFFVFILATVFCLSSAIAADVEIFMYFWKCANCDTTYVTNTSDYPNSILKCDNNRKVLHIWTLKNVKTHKYSDKPKPKKAKNPGVS